MTAKQFRENEDKFKNRIEIAQMRLESALKAYNDYEKVP